MTDVEAVALDAAADAIMLSAADALDRVAESPEVKGSGLLERGYRETARALREAAHDKESPLRAYLRERVERSRNSGK